MFDSLGKVSGNCCQGGDCWVVTTHLVVTFVWRFLKHLAFHMPETLEISLFKCRSP
jgi:hypothetical protein